MDEAAYGRTGRFENIAAALLVGGASTRMGRDKASLVLGEVPFAVRLARLLASCCDEVLLVGGEEAPPDAPGRFVADGAGPPSSLRGLVSALEAASAERVLVVATDLPLLSPELLLGLCAWPARQAVVPRDAKGVHPLCALYEREPVLEVARKSLAAGRLALHELLERLDVGFVEGQALAELDPDGTALSNVNTPRDLSRVRKLSRRAAAE
ncbi:MAG: molybdenum cofactor guanylyltransferase [Proteobacteria bacterium]|nr:molybdenum cofactor guanylyltransferase [Pseudomonadota bacterium]